MPTDVRRIATDSVDPTAKNYHWGDFTQGLITAKETGFDNTLLLDADGLVTEGPGFNVFMVKDGVVRTPRKGVLGGITRKVAMEIAMFHGLAMEEVDIPLAEFSNGAIGPLTKQMRQTYWDWHKDRAMSEPVRYEGRVQPA